MVRLWGEVGFGRRGLEEEVGEGKRDSFLKVEALQIIFKNYSYC